MVALDEKPERSSGGRLMGYFLLGLVLGVALGGGVVAYWYDPSLFSLKPTIDKPLPPRPPEEGTLVVDPLSDEWNFAQAEVPWAPVVPLAQISDASYMEGAQLEGTLREWGFTQIEEITHESMFACVASNDDVLVVAFRGTSDAVDWLTNFDLRSTQVEHGWAHRGFYFAVRDLLEATNRAAREQGLGRKRLWITGHSLGGALALLFAYDCLRMEAEPTGVVTFGQPMVVDGGLAAFLNEGLGRRYLRLVNGGDMVTRMVPLYSHCGNMAWFTGGDYQFVRPASRARSLSRSEPAAALPYGAGPPPMTVAEFEDLKRSAAEHAPRRADGGPRTIEKARGAPAALQDHYMTGYLHWVSVFAERSKVVPVPAESAGGNER